MTWHLIPESDIKEHELSISCSCDPRIDMEAGKDHIIVIHNEFSFDDQLTNIFKK